MYYFSILLLLGASIQAKSIGKYHQEKLKSCQDGYNQAVKKHQISLKNNESIKICELVHKKNKSYYGTSELQNYWNGANFFTMLNVASKKGKKEILTASCKAGAFMALGPMEDSVKEKGLTLSVAVHEICVGPIKEGQTVKRTRFNDDKKLIEEYFVKRHKGQFVKHGSFKQFHANGKMSRFANYKDGELHGKHFYYNKDGSEREASRYLAGKKHGEYKRWNDKKQLVEEGHYEHDKKHGMWKQYRKGKIDMEVEYKKGKYVKKTTY